MVAARKRSIIVDKCIRHSGSESVFPRRQTENQTRGVICSVQAALLTVQQALSVLLHFVNTALGFQIGLRRLLYRRYACGKNNRCPQTAACWSADIPDQLPDMTPSSKINMKHLNYWNLQKEQNLHNLPI